MKRVHLQTVGYLLISCLFLVSCGTEYNPEEATENEISKTEPVAPDKTLETVTWNLEWYGDGTYSEQSGNEGPSDETQQLKNILKVTDSLNADLYAFQEIYSQKALNDISKNMSGYRGFVANHINWIQKTAVIFNTNTIDSLASGSITNVREEYQQDWEYYWAGRLPMYFSFNYTFENTTEEFYAVIIHGKANTGDNDEEYKEAYERRKRAAEGLYYYLKDHKPNANIILLGDYNDDVDQSIYYNSEGKYQETPYYQFVNDSTNFDVITKELSDSGQSASINYEDLIDHITVSDELFDNYVQNSTAIYNAPQSYIDNYGHTTSDHLPVWAKFDVTKQ